MVEEITSEPNLLVRGPIRPAWGVQVIKQPTEYGSRTS
jgi:hypothetical protein